MLNINQADDDVLAAVLDKTRVQNLWLDPAILDWEPQLDSGVGYPAEPILRAYEIHQHAEDLLDRATSELDRVDVITTLKRVIDHRLQLLDERYNLKGLPLHDRPKRALDILTYLGAVRPLMLRELQTIRNAVEHEDDRPPAASELHRYLDLTWYFLRSTDGAVRRVIHEREFAGRSPHDAPYGFGITFNPPLWAPYLIGWFAPRHVSKTHVDGWMTSRGTLDTSKSKGRADTRDSTDLHVIAMIRGPNDVIRQVIALSLNSDKD